MAPNVTQLRIVMFTLGGIGLVTTAIRLCLRRHRRKLWWDDFWVLIAALCTIILMVANFYHTGPPTSLSQHSKVIYYWLCVHFYYAITWTSRLSILYTIMRIAAPGTPMKLFLKISAAFFYISWIVLAAQVFWICVPEPTWKQQAVPQCVLDYKVAIAQVITYLGTDAILIFAPVQLIWGVQLPQATKIRLIAVFAATLITTSVSLYYIYAMLKLGGITEDFAATILDGFSLIVANLSVMTSFVFSVLSPASSDDVTNVPRPWYAPRRKPARSFPFVSTIKSLYQGEVVELPVQVNLHVEIERDFQTKSVVPPSDSESELGARRYTVHDERLKLGEQEERICEGRDTYELKEIMDPKV